jgi:hypothetical protein
MLARRAHDEQLCVQVSSGAFAAAELAITTPIGGLV